MWRPFSEKVTEVTSNQNGGMTESRTKKGGHIFNIVFLQADKKED